jgi:hypothetical protein
VQAPGKRNGTDDCTGAGHRQQAWKITAHHARLALDTLLN